MAQWLRTYTGARCQAPPGCQIRSGLLKPRAFETRMSSQRAKRPGSSLIGIQNYSVGQMSTNTWSKSNSIHSTTGDLTLPPFLRHTLHDQRSRDTDGHHPHTGHSRGAGHLGARYAKEGSQRASTSTGPSRTLRAAGGVPLITASRKFWYSPQSTVKSWEGCVRY